MSEPWNTPATQGNDHWSEPKAEDRNFAAEGIQVAHMRLGKLLGYLAEQFEDEHRDSQYVLEEVERRLVSIRENLAVTADLAHVQLTGGHD
jgi:hypothetical protein